MFQRPSARPEVAGAVCREGISEEEKPMRFVAAYVLPLLVAASTSGLLLSAAIV